MNWRKIAMAPTASLGSTLKVMDEAGQQIALIIDADDRLLGIVTDGDVRRALLKGKDLNTPIGECMNVHPLALPDTTSSEDILRFMRRHSIHQVPLLNAAGRIVGLELLDRLIGVVRRPNAIVIMAGGLGTRLLPLTESIPKPLLQVGGKPILQRILESFVAAGFQRFYLTVNYKAEMIQTYFGDGERWGVQITYLRETKRMGTAGALSLIKERLDAPVLVMNGDILTEANFIDILSYHQHQQAAATMVVREYEFQVPFGVVDLEHERIVSIREKPTYKMFVNAGIYVLNPEVIAKVPKDEYFDMPTLFEYINDHERAKTVAYILREYWLDIGRHEELEKARLDILPE